MSTEDRDEIVKEEKISFKGKIAQFLSLLAVCLLIFCFIVVLWKIPAGNLNFSICIAVVLVLCLLVVVIINKFQKPKVDEFREARNTQWRLGCADKHYQNKRYEDALNNYRRAASADPESVEPWLGLARSYGKLKRLRDELDGLKKAAENIDKLLDGNPGQLEESKQLEYQKIYDKISKRIQKLKKRRT